MMTKEQPQEEKGIVVETGFKVVQSRKNRKKSDEEMQKGLMAFTKDEMETVKIDAVMDSGAHDTVCPKDMLGGNEIRQTEASKAGYNWYGPNGNPIKNLGEGDMRGVSEDGIPVEFTAQVGEGVKRMLVSVNKVCKGGNMVIFGANMKAIRDLAKLDKVDENMIVGTKSGVRSEIKEKHGMYVYPMTVNRKKKKGDAMDIGMTCNSFSALESGPDGDETLKGDGDEWTIF